MLTDEQIEQILYKYTRRQDEFNLSIIRIIAERLSALADFDNLNTLKSTEITVQEITQLQRLHKRYVQDQIASIEEDFWWIVAFLYGEALTYYEVQRTLKENTELCEETKALIKEAQTRLKEILSNPVIVLRDLKNPAALKVYNLEQAYTSVINEALTYSNVSAELRDIALKRTETQLFDSGVRYLIDNSSNDVESTKNANQSVRFNVLDSTKNLITKVQETMGKQFGANGLELSAHIYPAPDHAPAQGHQFTKENVAKMQAGEDFEDLEGHKYVGFERNIGQWNCRHYFMQIKISAKPQYTQSQLDKIIKDNEKGYTDENGKHRTLYECTQIQRRYEREIRNAKQKYLYGKALNNKQMMANARNAVGRLTTRYKQFSRNCDIPAKLERIRVKDYN